MANSSFSKADNERSPFLRSFRIAEFLTGLTRGRGSMVSFKKRLSMG